MLQSSNNDRPSEEEEALICLKEVLGEDRMTKDEKPPPQDPRLGHFTEDLRANHEELQSLLYFLLFLNYVLTIPRLTTILL